MDLILEIVLSILEMKNTIPKQVIGGLVNLNEYFAEYVNDDEFRLYEDDSLTIVDLTSVTTGINTFIKGNREFFNFEKISAHTSYQRIKFAPATPSLILSLLVEKLLKLSMVDLQLICSYI